MDAAVERLALSRPPYVPFHAVRGRTASSITTAQALPVTVTVSGGNPIPTGTVTLTSGTYASAATTLNNGSAAINIPPGALATGTDTLTASYRPDSSSSSTYSSAVGHAPVTVTAANPSFAVSGTAVTVAPSMAYADPANVSFNPHREGANGNSSIFSKDELLPPLPTRNKRRDTEGTK